MNMTRMEAFYAALPWHPAHHRTRGPLRRRIAWPLLAMSLSFGVCACVAHSVDRASGAKADESAAERAAVDTWLEDAPARPRVEPPDKAASASAAQVGPALVVVEAPEPETTLDPDTAATPAAAQVVSTVIGLRDSVVETRYQGKRVVEPENGIYAWDCSGMAAWILRKSAPGARRALQSSRPLAKRFFKVIEGAPTSRSRRGWQRLEHVSDARPGDLFSWLRSPVSKSRVTGHVGFFVEQPHSLPDHPEIYVARIVDSTSLPHGHDTRPRGGEGGFGFGTMLFFTDETGETVAYGWHGLNSLEWGTMPARVIYGRVTK